MRIHGRSGHRGEPNGNGRSDFAEQHRARRTAAEEKLEKLKNATHACQKKSGGRLGPPAKILGINGNRVELKLPHERKPTSLHVLDVEPVVPV